MVKRLSKVGLSGDESYKTGTAKELRAQESAILKAPAVARRKRSLAPQLRPQAALWCMKRWTCRHVLFDGLSSEMKLMDSLLLLLLLPSSSPADLESWEEREGVTYLLQFTQCLRANTSLLEITLRCRDDLFDDLEVHVALLQRSASTGLVGHKYAPASSTHHQRVRHVGGGRDVVRYTVAEDSGGWRYCRKGKNMAAVLDVGATMPCLMAVVAAFGGVRRLVRGAQVS